MPEMSMLEIWELASYVVTVIGLPFALFAYLLDQKKERQNEDDEIYQKLSDEYAEFSKLLLENADLRLMSKYSPDEILEPEQIERKRVMFDILVSLFERAFILVYEENMSPHSKRHWSSWEDYIRFWLRRHDFCVALEELLDGEDPDFQRYMKNIAKPTLGRAELSRAT